MDRTTPGLGWFDNLTGAQRPRVFGGVATPSAGGRKCAARLYTFGKWGWGGPGGADAANKGIPGSSPFGVTLRAATPECNHLRKGRGFCRRRRDFSGRRDPRRCCSGAPASLNRVCLIKSGRTRGRVIERDGDTAVTAAAEERL